MLIKKMLPLLLPVLLGGTILFAQPTGGYRDKIDAILKEALIKDVYAGSVLVLKNNNTLYEKSIGAADIEKNILNTGVTTFSIGSITKLFTKTVILQLIEEKKLDFQEKIIDLLPGFTDPLCKQITVEQLLEHTSGLGDYADSGTWEDASEEINSVTGLLLLIQKEKLLFAPGTSVKYSNSGYAVLAALIEKITGKLLGDAYQNMIFGKLKMGHSAFGYFNKNMDGKAIGYLTNFIGPKRNNLHFKMMGAGDGGIYSSTTDMCKFAHSIMSDNILLADGSKLKLFNSPVFQVHYASWDECKQKGRLSIAGGAPGVSAVLAMNMEKNYCFVVLSNYDEGSAETIAQGISAALNDKAILPLPLPPSRFIYGLIKEKGAENFVANYKKELQAAGIQLEDDMVLLSVGETLLEEKNAEAALALYTVYTKEFPNIIVAWNDMGDAWLLKGDKANAKKCFEQALKLRPANEKAKRALKDLQ